jgi:hypothetical protein
LFRTLRCTLLMAALMIVVLPGCGNETSWKQGDPVELPTEAAEFSDLVLEIDRRGDELAFEARCKESAEFTEVKIEVRTEGSVESARYAITPERKNEVVTCEPGAAWLQGQTPVFDEMETGDELWVRLEFHKPDGFGAAKEHLYMMGTDGRLRDGAGSVWQ